jgi:PadR family transcriptional regulator PadR
MPVPPARILSPATTAVLKAIADGVRYGFDIMDATALPSGTVYPILSRLESSALLRARWESHAIAQREKRPPRRYYEITAAGNRTLALALAHYRALGSGAGRRHPARG